MAAIDIKKVPREPTLVKVPSLTYLMVDGKGDPNVSEDFREAIQALYGLSYTLKFQLKKEGVEHVVGPLEGLFHAKDPSVFLTGKKKEWEWTLMILQPKEVTAKRLAAARGDLMRKKKLASLPDVRLAKLAEGLCAQVLHIGPYAAEGPTIQGLHRFMEESGCTFAGAHHEIYLSDPGRTAPERLKTIIRQPVRRITRGARLKGA
jgi:hypothetical protein